MTLALYNKKRKFDQTSEPKGEKKAAKAKALEFVVQKHWASRLHYDFRLEMDGAMKSWAVPKGPSLDPEVKRLAMQVEDHPVSYNIFEGIIPEGNYGAGRVIIWDKGVYTSETSGDKAKAEKELLKGLKRGRLKFVMLGKKLKGGFALVRMSGKDKEWLLVKEEDEYAKKTKRKKNS
jgi:bifunctional non-homologous end joining protein LigD